MQVRNHRSKCKENEVQVYILYYADENVSYASTRQKKVITNTKRICQYRGGAVFSGTVLFFLACNFTY